MIFSSCCCSYLVSVNQALPTAYKQIMIKKNIYLSNFAKTRPLGFVWIRVQPGMSHNLSLP